MPQGDYPSLHKALEEEVSVRSVGLTYCWVQRAQRKLLWLQARAAQRAGKGSQGGNSALES